MQEVEKEHYDDYFNPVLSAAGYKGFYKQKTAEIFAASSSQKGGGRFTMDGCASFFLEDRFRVIDSAPLEFAALAKAAYSPQNHMQHHLHHSQRRSGNQGPPKRLLKDNVALLLLLEIRDEETQRQQQEQQQGAREGGDLHPSHKRILVVNTHVAANPDSNDVKLWQTQTLLG